MNGKLVKEILVPISDYPNIRDGASVKDAFLLLKNNFEKGKGYRSILVVDEKNQLKGLVAMRDLIQAVEPRFLKASKPDAYQGLSPEYPALSLIWQELFSEECKEEAKKAVKEVMAPVQATVTLEDPIAKAAYLLIMTNSHILPILDKDKVIGVVRLVDVFKEITDVVFQG